MIKQDSPDAIERIEIMPAVIADHSRLSQVCKQSKAYWGYSSEQMAVWDEELTIKPSYIAEFDVYKLLLEGELIAFYSFEKLSDDLVELDNLFLLPAYIGKGYGKHLLEDFLSRVKALDFKKVILDADPNAAAFYRAQGFVTVGKKPTSIPGRFMPIMEKNV